MNYWLMKSEPDTFSIDDLKHRPKRTEHWDGVRNYQARNYLRDGMQKGDLAFFYHSSCAQPGIVGIMEIVRAGYPDRSADDPNSPYFDPKTTPEHPRWYMVDVHYVRHMRHIISLKELSRHAVLQGMPLLKKGNRLSIMPVTDSEWRYILGLESR